MSLFTSHSESLDAIGKSSLGAPGLDSSQFALMSASGVDSLDERIEPLRQAWWMKHLSLLAIMQAACLAVGLMVHSLTDSVLTVSFLATFTWITCIQGALSYLIFSRLYRYHSRQQETLSGRVKAQGQALIRTRDAMILGLTRLAEIRDGDTEGHLNRVGALSARLAEVAAAQPEFRDQIDTQFIRLIRFSAALHDIGKVGIEDAILLKPGQLTQEERSKMECHTQISSRCLNQIEDCLGDSNFLQMAHEIALFHHERWDGSGYPTGISGEQIPLSARIVAIADVYDALAARRPYKEPYLHQRCVEIITAESGTHFDPRLVELFLSMQHEFARVSQSNETPAVPEKSTAVQDAASLNSPGYLDNEPSTQLSETGRQLQSIMSAVDAMLPASPD
jgi:HD-GYP domain-containing protein (c-di-GMP phosphodiesterase class II)